VRVASNVRTKGEPRKDARENLCSHRGRNEEIMNPGTQDLMHWCAAFACRR
jgi:hypothetical protein